MIACWLFGARPQNHWFSGRGHPNRYFWGHRSTGWYSQYHPPPDITHQQAVRWPQKKELFGPLVLVSLRKRGAESPDASHDACLSCMHYSSYHQRCACSMPWCVRAHGARTRPRSVSGTAAKEPGRRHRQRIGTHSYMQSSLHAITYNFLFSCRMACSMVEFQARMTRGSLQRSRRTARTSDYVRRRARRTK